jgi:hypothetical protein
MGEEEKTVAGCASEVSLLFISSGLFIYPRLPEWRPEGKD